MMKVRMYGEKPYKVVVVHGGPGALGDMFPVCKELSKMFGVLEPLLAETTIEGQLNKLKDIIEAHSTSPIILIGHSWGAMLAYMFTSKYQHLVRKLILMSSGPLEEDYVAEFKKRREEKLTISEAATLRTYLKAFSDLKDKALDKHLAIVGEFMERINSFSLIDMPYEGSLFKYKTFQSISLEITQLRQTGEMFNMGKSIDCEVIVIHGTHDFHPAFAMKASLEKLGIKFRYYELDKCGHTPWKEKYAKKAFFDILTSVVSENLETKEGV